MGLDGGRREEVLVGKAIVISILQLIDGSDVYAKALTSYRNLDLNTESGRIVPIVPIVPRHCIYVRMQ